MSLRRALGVLVATWLAGLVALDLGGIAWGLVALDWASTLAAIYVWRCLARARVSGNSGRRAR